MTSFMEFMRCPKLEVERHRRMKDFNALFNQEGLKEPRTDEELTSALLNRGIFRVLVGSQHKYSVEGQPMVTKTKTITLKGNMVTAQQLASLICYKLQIKRDILYSEIQLLPTEGGSPD